MSSSPSSPSSSSSSLSTGGKPHPLLTCMASLGIFVVGVVVGSRASAANRRRRRSSSSSFASSSSSSSSSSSVLSEVSDNEEDDDEEIEQIDASTSANENTDPLGTSTLLPAAQSSRNSETRVVSSSQNHSSSSSSSNVLRSRNRTRAPDGHERPQRSHDPDLLGGGQRVSVHSVGRDDANGDENSDKLLLSSAVLDCPICLTEMVLPRVTNCGHTICTSCLLALCEHERRPACPVCRQRLRPPVERLPVNFTVKAVVEERMSARGEEALRAYRIAEESVLPFVSASGGGGNNSNQQSGASNSNSANGYGNGHSRDVSIARRLRPAWNWFKWTVIIVTEFGAFIVSLKELLDANPATRNRRYQRIV